jgi:hypothetical protein
VTVADNSLDQIISRLRRSLSESGARNLCITTERGRGYRLMADVRRVSAVASRGNASVLYEATCDPHAHHFFSQALTLSARPGPDNLGAAFELVQQALALDPQFAPALAYRALLRTVFVAFDLPMDDSLAIAEREARQALAIDPALSYGHHGLANVSAARGAWNDAAEHYETASALERAPHARISRTYQLFQSVGHMQRSLTETESLDRFAPSQPLGTFAQALASMLLGHDAEAQRHADRACTLGWPRTNSALQDIYFQLALRGRRFSEAADSMNASLGRSMRAAGGAEAVKLLCAALHLCEQRKRAIAALVALVQRLPANELGLVDRKRMVLWLTLLGGLEQAFDLMNRSLDHLSRRGMVGTSWGMLWMPEMQSFRRDPRFEHVAARMRLPDYWRRHGPPDESL